MHAALTFLTVTLHPLSHFFSRFTHLALCYLAIGVAVNAIEGGLSAFIRSDSTVTVEISFIKSRERFF